MLQIHFKKVGKAFGEQTILKEITFSVAQGDRIGIVGANGSGKTTLLRLLAGKEEKDWGEIFRAGELRQSLLQQNSTVDGGDPVPNLSTVDRPLFQLGGKPDSPCPSGGEKTRLALSQILGSQPDLLLLDEPTNNLDFEGLNALAALLNTYRGTVIVVSHDRWFLDRTVTRILEIQEGLCTEYAGNYTDYREEKQRNFSQQLHRYDAEQKRQKKIEQTIRQVSGWSEKAHRESTKRGSGEVTMGFKEYHRAKAKRMDKQVKSQIKRLEKLKNQGPERPVEEKNVYFQIAGNSNRGKRMIQATGVSKRFGERVLFADSDFCVLRGEKIALFGENGCGKSTLIRMLTGQEAATHGEIWVSPSAKPFVLEQTFDTLPGDQSILEYLGHILRNVSGYHRTVLHNMGLEKNQLSRPIKTLSYGEQTKLKMAEAILKNWDFLILDEPTNHLDLHSRKMLENTLSQYAGTLLVVSHDLYFLQKLCDKVLLFEEGRIRRLENSFAQFWETRTQGEGEW
ncbi:ABC-F family ATP-binding cassette domain-containing protein [Oscillospiraceae bacterium MB08-C2-2]|nr:ABC-F family ATP-binding cassette domain-containing protein [Oscillospiraceae bacterium MB08-C2-2]